MTPLMVTVKDAAHLLALSEKAVYDLAADGKLEKKYVGKGTRNFRLTTASLERFVESLDRDPKPEADVA